MLEDQYVYGGESVASPTDNRRRAEVTKKVSPEVEYEIALDRSEGYVLTPLAIPNFKEIQSGTTKNRELVAFYIRNRKSPADQVSIEVMDGEKVIYTEKDTAKFLPDGRHSWMWDGYGDDGILDTKVLKSESLRIRLTAQKEDVKKTFEFKLRNSAAEEDWVDVKINRNTKKVDVTVRPGYSDGGISGSNPNLTALTYAQLQELAKAGIEKYWSRDGTRPGNIAQSISAASGDYAVKVTADVNASPKASVFKLVEELSPDFNRSTSLGGFRKVAHNAGYFYFWRVTEENRVRGNSLPANEIARLTAMANNEARILFEHTAAHEFGHLILNSYCGTGVS